MIYTVAGLPPADNRREWLLLPFAPICFAAQCPDAGCGVPAVDTPRKLFYAPTEDMKITLELLRPDPLPG
jgi:hypothetical protein